MSETQRQLLLRVPAGIVTKRQRCYLLPFIPVAFDVFNAVCTQECAEALLLPFPVQGKRDIASYTQKVLEHLMPLEISCSGALKHLRKAHTPEGLVKIPSTVSYTLTSHREPRGGTSKHCGTERRAPPKGWALPLWYPQAQLALSIEQGCLAKGKLHLKHGEHQCVQSQSTKAGGCVLEHPFSMV